MADMAILECVKANTIEIPPEVIIPEEHPDSTLANEVKQLFNYGLLAETVQVEAKRAEAEKVARTRLVNLKNALADNEIDVITNASVEKYQKQMVKENNAPLIRAERPNLIIKEVFLSLGFLSFFVSFYSVFLKLFY